MMNLSEMERMHTVNVNVAAVYRNAPRFMDSPPSPDFAHPRAFGLDTVTYEMCSVEPDIGSFVDIDDYWALYSAYEDLQATLGSVQKGIDEIMESLKCL